MKKIISVLIILIGCSFVSPAQTGKKTSLFVSHCEATEGVCKTRQLVRYDFVDGAYLGQEKIVSADDLRFDSWNDKIYRNRYVITRWGDIVDIVDKKILHVGDGELHRIENDKIFIKVDRENKEGLYVFDLPTKKYELVRKTDKSMWFGELSPNGLRSTEYRCPVKGDCGIEISEPEKKKTFIKGRFSLLRYAGPSTSEMMRVPIFWLDDERILTQRTNGELVVVSLDGKITPLLKIKIDGYPSANPRLYRNAAGDIVYRCVGEYVIDLENKSYREIVDSTENGFSVKDNDAVKSDFGVGRIFYFNGGEIGKIWAGPPATTKDYLAAIYGKDGSNLGYPDGVKVWNAFKKDWTTFEIKWGAEIVGWVSE
jgi:hypothetical protein